jgi:glycine betaine catabolism B
MKPKKPVACTVSSMEQEGKFFLLTVKFPPRFRFKAGQFVKIYLDAKGKDFEPFSFFSAPEEKKIQFMFDTASEFKQRLSQKKKGAKLYMEGPYGDFAVSKKPSHSVLLCRGLGLIPLSSIGKSLIDQKKKLNIYLLYENMDRKEILNEARLVEFDKHKQVNILMTLLNERPMDWPGKIGPITAEMISEFVPKPKGKDYYICGPPTFVNRMLALLGELGVPKKKISAEPWD